MPYNPFDLFPLTIGGNLVYARPIELDSAIVNQKLTTNGFGNLVKPKRVITTCPGCSLPLTIELRNLPDPPFKPIVAHCEKCFPIPIPPPDPFVNPLEFGRIALHDLDPLIMNMNDRLVDDGKTAQQRMLERGVLPLDPPILAKESDLLDTAEAVMPSGVREVLLEPADDEFGNEVDFDDDDLIEGT